MFLDGGEKNRSLEASTPIFRGDSMQFDDLRSFFHRGWCNHKLVFFFDGRYIQFVVPGSQIRGLDILYNSDDDMTELCHQCPTKSMPGMPGQEAVTFFDEVSISPTMQTETYS